MYGWWFLISSVTIILANLSLPYSAMVDPSSTPMWVNCMYYGCSRTCWILAVAMLLISIFVGQFPVGAAFLSVGNMRLLSQSIAMGSLVLVLCIHALFCSSNMEQGLDITFAFVLLFGLGFNLVGFVVAIVCVLLFEFPLKRVY